MKTHETRDLHGLHSVKQSRRRNTQVDTPDHPNTLQTIVVKEISSFHRELIFGLAAPINIQHLDKPFSLVAISSSCSRLLKLFFISFLVVQEFLVSSTTLGQKYFTRESSKQSLELNSDGVT